MRSKYSPACGTQYTIKLLAPRGSDRPVKHGNRDYSGQSILNSEKFTEKETLFYVLVHEVSQSRAKEEFPPSPHHAEIE